MHVFGIRVPLRRLAGIEQLSAAERSVLRGLARGAMSAEAIARERAVSSNTLGKQVASIFSKLGVRSRAELARLLADADLAVPALGAPSRPRTPRREEPVRVLVADDHAPSCEELCAIVGDAGYLVSAAHGLAEARHRLAEGAFEAALLDLRLADESALEILRAGAPCPVVLLSGAAELDEAVEGLLLGAALNLMLARWLSSREEDDGQHSFLGLGMLGWSVVGVLGGGAMVVYGLVQAG